MTTEQKYRELGETMLRLFPDAGWVLFVKTDDAHHHCTNVVEDDVLEFVVQQMQAIRDVGPTEVHRHTLAKPS